MRNILSKTKTTLAEAFSTPTNCGLILLCSLISLAGLCASASECAKMRDEMGQLSQDLDALQESQYDLMEYIILRDLSE